MKKLTYLIGVALWFMASSLPAAEPITGSAAKRVWNRLPGPQAGPFCTGLCNPGQPCDPPCFYHKEGQGWQCTRTEYLKSHRVEYECQRSR